MTRTLSILLISIMALTFFGPWAVADELSIQFKNDGLIAQFGPRGLVAITDHESGMAVHFPNDEFALLVDGTLLNSSQLSPTVRKEESGIAYYYTQRGYSIRVSYELRTGWKFLTKRLQILDSPGPAYTLAEIEPLRLTLRERILNTFTPGTYLPQFGPTADGLRVHFPSKQFGAFLRLEKEQGLMLVVQNPFLEVERNGQNTEIRYRPEMTWRKEWGTWSSDPAVIGLYRQSGRRIPARLVYEWKLTTNRDLDDGADENEIQAFTECVRRFLVHPPSSPISVEVGWTLNDYQINVATAAGRSEYQRVIDTASALGIQALLYAPADSSLADRDNDADDWNWEHVLWLGLGQKIRKGEWSVEKSPIPDTVTEMLDYAKARHLGILAYIYPSLPFAQNSVWIVTDPRKKTKNSYATLASREFQDFLVHQLLAFKHRTGIAGYSFDYAFFNVPGSSPYSQWWGWRRVMESLRVAEPGIIIDGRQTYQMYGPWSWVAGSYPHPTGNDEQPESFTPYPDLHFDRVSADRTRFVNYWYRNYEFAPQEVIPGYMTHQTPRNINTLAMDGSVERQETTIVYTGFRRRDWDYLGYKYSVLSSIATGSWNNVIDMIPGRDPAESEHFSESDKSWIRQWLKWTVDNKQTLEHTKTILGQPAMGYVDGTAAIVGNRGYIFLFNPNYKKVRAEFTWDGSTGLTENSGFVLRELYPEEGRLVGESERGIWKYGDVLSILMDGTSARVLELVPASELTKSALVFGVSSIDRSKPPVAILRNQVLSVEHAAGEMGTEKEVSVLLPSADRVKELRINGKMQRFVQKDRYLSSQVRFAGTVFSHSEELLLHRESTGSFAGTFLIPERIKRQLATRSELWPIPWTKEDYQTPWLVPERLLLFVQIAEPNDAMAVEMEMDGSPLALTRAYSSVREHPPSFLGWYADFSGLDPEKIHSIRLTLPGIEPSRFQGLFFDNIESEYTEQLAP